MHALPCETRATLTVVVRTIHSERRGGIATAPPLRRSYSDRAVRSPGGAFQTHTNLANHRHRTRLLADCQWRCRWRCGLGRLRNTRSLTETIPRDRRKLIKLMLRKWTFDASLAPDSSVRKATPSDITERTARSGAVVEAIFLSRPRRAQCMRTSAQLIFASARNKPRARNRAPHTCPPNTNQRKMQ